MGRKQARETAMQCLYQMDMHGEYTVDRIDAYIESIGQNDADKIFVGQVVRNFIQHKDAVDQEISSHLKKGWKIDRIAKIDLAILRIAMTEILFNEDIPESVSINEAVNLSKKFSDDESSSFINGLLGATVGNKA
ncbi:transcription antitermination factor NusB [Fusibacter sp. JL216-2]|uniref:transcription antitermination factor NusB n=1 Tax=Fusibacter sp. JL216-2 TaxID=3071453 RepID=UPI003D32918A